MALLVLDVRESLLSSQSHPLRHHATIPASSAVIQAVHVIPAVMFLSRIGFSGGTSSTLALQEEFISRLNKVLPELKETFKTVDRLYPEVVRKAKAEMQTFLRGKKLWND